MKTWGRMVEQGPSNWVTSTGNTTKTFLVGDSTAKTYTSTGGRSPCRQMRNTIWWDLADYVTSGKCVADMMKVAEDKSFDENPVVIVVFAFNDLVNTSGAIVEPQTFPSSSRHCVA